MIRRALPLLLAALALACTGSTSVVRSDGLDAAALPEAQRADYAVFANRCSKCHALSRPLSSGIVDDAFWVRYVERMRLQPASGISPEDVAPILRFLHRYSEEQRRLKEAAERAKDAGP
jgi:mono/diheme cytochrome c family protein